MRIEISYSSLTTYRQVVEVADGMDDQAINDYALNVATSTGALESEHETSHGVELDDWNPIT